MARERDGARGDEHRGERQARPFCAGAQCREHGFNARMFVGAASGEMMPLPAMPGGAVDMSIGGMTGRDRQMRDGGAQMTPARK